MSDPTGVGREAESCTVELSTGSFVHLAMKPSAVAELRHRGGLQPVRRMVGAGIRWETMHLDPSAIVAIYALDERPEQYGGRAGVVERLMSP